MTVNVFEGAQRVVRITAVLWVVAVCAMAMIYFEPSITIRYLVEGIPIPMKDDWDPLDAFLPNVQVSDDPLDKYLATTQKISEYQRSEYQRASGRAAMERTEDKACADHPAQSSRELITEKGINVFVILCFADNGNTGLIPVRYDETGKFWMMVSPYSQEGRGYRSRVAKEFTLPKVDEEWADSQWWVELKDSIKVGLGFLAGGWALLWTLTWTIGWIVRGFLGIPTGQDRGVEKG